MSLRVIWQYMDRSIYCHMTLSAMNYLLFIVPQYMNITTKFSTIKLLFFSFTSCLTIERSIVFKIMDRQCELCSRIFSSATGLDKRFIFIRNTRTSSSINENSEIFNKISKISKHFKIFMISNFLKFQFS